jgi:antitoxin component YwqK of YwqJK toxin-antitoxin module
MNSYELNQTNQRVEKQTADTLQNAEVQRAESNRKSEIAYATRQSRWAAPDSFRAGRLKVGRSWHSHDKLKEETTYLNGKEHGIRKEFYESGNIKSRSGYKNSNLHGVRRQTIWDQSARFLRDTFLPVTSPV